MHATSAVPKSASFYGETFASRHSASSLCVDLPDGIAPDRDAYVERAMRRASDISALARLRGGLCAPAKANSLCAPRFGRNLVAALRCAWEEASEREAPAAGVARGKRKPNVCSENSRQLSGFI